jgi:chorismate synthase
VKILSGTFEGKTSGTPISLIIYNKDAKSRDYDTIKDVFRPGHGDLTYQKKYGIRDHRGGGRSSGRETAARVAAGAIARKLLDQKKINVKAYALELAGVRAEKVNLDVIDDNLFFAPDLHAVKKMGQRIAEIKQSGDSAGGIVEVAVHGCPAGLGEPVFDKLDAELARAIMSIGAVKAVEIGVGVEAVKPTTISVQGRHDVSAVPRIVPVAEAMVCLVLADHLLRQRTLG